jgi:hypothetical protein
VGRWVYLDGMRNGVWTAHSLALTFFFGPAGVLSHLLTLGVVRIFRWDVKDIMAAGTGDVAPSAAEGVAKKMIQDAEKQVGVVVVVVVVVNWVFVVYDASGGGVVAGCFVWFRLI